MFVYQLKVFDMQNDDQSGSLPPNTEIKVMTLVAFSNEFQVSIV